MSGKIEFYKKKTYKKLKFQVSLRDFCYNRLFCLLFNVDLAVYQSGKYGNEPANAGTALETNSSRLRHPLLPIRRPSDDSNNSNGHEGQAATPSCDYRRILGDINDVRVYYDRIGD